MTHESLEIIPTSSTGMVFRGHDPLGLSEVVLAERHPAAVYLASLAPGSRRTMRASLDAIAALLTASRCDAMTLNWSLVRYEHSAAVRAVLASRYAVAGANKMLSALRGVLRAAWRLGLMSAEAYQLATDVAAVRGSALPAGRALSSGELRALFRTCAEGRGGSGARDAAVLALAYGAGLRRSEIVALDLEDFDAQTGALTVRRGKGRKDRLAYIANGAFAAVADWIAVRGSGPGPLFWPVNKGGRLLPRRLSDHAVYTLMKRLASHAEVAAFTPHDCRRTMIGDLLDAGVDISTVQRLVGHSAITTTSRYDRRGETAKRKASNVLSVPYVTNRLAARIQR